MIRSNRIKGISNEVRDGLIFIPDISGFTELVHTTDTMTGRQITYELLSAVIGANELDLRIAEVEGDAVLFYRYGKAPSYQSMMSQYEKMAKAFDTKKIELEQRFSISLDLSLKATAHYGPMTSYVLGHFEKLYGEVVVEAHRLLKNSISSGTYLLLTDALKEQMVLPETVHVRSGSAAQLCELYGPLGNICFTYIDYAKGKEKLVA